MNHHEKTGINSTISNVSDWFTLLSTEGVVYGKQQDMTPEDLARIKRAADNMLDIVTKGMEAVGDLQWHACTNTENQPEMLTLIDLGAFQKTLAELVGRLHVLSNSAAGRAHQREVVLGGLAA